MAVATFSNASLTVSAVAVATDSPRSFTLTTSAWSLTVVVTSLALATVGLSTTDFAVAVVTPLALATAGLSTTDFAAVVVAFRVLVTTELSTTVLAVVAVKSAALLPADVVASTRFLAVVVEKSFALVPADAVASVIVLAAVVTASLGVSSVVMSSPGPCWQSSRRSPPTHSSVCL